MRRIPVLFIALLCLAGCSAETPLDDSSAEESAVVGNDRANSEHPEVVQLRFRSGPTEPEYTCTGTVIGPRSVITARHCIPEVCLGRAVVDRAGKSANAGESYTVAECAVVRRGLEAWTNDIAVVGLDRPVVGVVPATIATSDPGSRRFVAYGYGSFGEALGVKCGQRSDGNKRRVEYIGRIGITFGQKLCPGDSGGPHFVAGTSIIAGLTSGGVPRVEASSAPFRYGRDIAEIVARYEEGSR